MLNEIKVKKLLFICLFVIACCSCSSPWILGEKLTKHSNNIQLKDPGDVMVGLALSGGGSRAALFSASVINEFLNNKKLHIQKTSGNQEKIPFARAIDDVSSVSGGSFTAAYWAIHPNFNWTKAKTKLAHDFVSPVVWGNVFYTRRVCELLSDEIQSCLFSHKHPTLDRLIVKEGPNFIINAANITNQTMFTFTPRQFDKMRLDYKSFPLAAAVVASASYPEYIEPLRLRNYSEINGYIDLQDAAIIDNLGVIALMRRYEQLMEKYPQRRALVIVVDAKLERDNPEQATVAEMIYNSRHSQVIEILRERPGFSVIHLCFRDLIYISQEQVDIIEKELPGVTKRLQEIAAKNEIVAEKLATFSSMCEKISYIGAFTGKIATTLVLSETEVDMLELASKILVTLHQKSFIDFYEGSGDKQLGQKKYDKKWDARLP